MMKRNRDRLMGFVLIAACCSLSRAAADTESGPTGVLDRAIAAKIEGSELLWYDIRALGVEGRGWEATSSFYDRLPARAKGVVRDPVWRLSQHSAGMCVRFVTGATGISARWTLRSSNLAMPHMPATGVSGLDLYARDEAGKWRWVNVGRPSAATNQQSLASGLKPGRREYLLYLPLYNGVESVQLGVPPDETLAKAPPRPGGDKPVVFYGTSITHGGCASRPGMCYAAILGRRLDCPTINLGFSGNGKMEQEVADLLAEVDASAYFVNCLPNMTGKEVAERTEPLVRTVRKAHPKTPIILVEDRSYTNAYFLPSRGERNRSSRVELKRAYARLQSAGVEGLYYIEGEAQLGSDGEAAVDGSHPTDLGFLRMADAFEPVLRQALGR